MLLMTPHTLRARAEHLAHAALLEAERETRSRMLAYDRVARSLKVSPSWVRKLVAGLPLRIDAHTYVNLSALGARVDAVRAAYDAACDRLEAEADEFKNQCAESAELKARVQGNAGRGNDDAADVAMAAPRLLARHGAAKRGA